MWREVLDKEQGREELSNAYIQPLSQDPGSGLGQATPQVMGTAGPSGQGMMVTAWDPPSLPSSLPSPHSSSLLLP